MTPAEALLDLGLDDILQLSEIVWVVRSTGQLADSPSGMEETLDVVFTLLEQNLAEVGDAVLAERLEPGQEAPRPWVEFIPWGGSAADAIERIRSEWTALGRRPTLGEVCWLALTERGRARALQAREARGER